MYNDIIYWYDDYLDQDRFEEKYYIIHPKLKDLAAIAGNEHPARKNVKNIYHGRLQRRA